MQLRDYQSDINNRVIEAWDTGIRSVCEVLPTGAGKTPTAVSLIKQMGVPTICIAHRQELILQISEALAAFGIQHRILAPPSVIKFCTERHIKKFGTAFTHGRDVLVVSVQTLIRRKKDIAHLIPRIRLVFQDECHHALPENQWGTAINFFPNANVLGVTATPTRCDRKPLSGMFDKLVEGPTPRELINMGFLTEYRIFCPPVSIDANSLRISKSTGEYVKADLIDANHESNIVGDVVSQYLKIAAGKRGLTFCVDRQSAKDITAAYNAAGVPALYVDGDTPDKLRAEASEKLISGEVLQLVNVDLFGEGYDVPAVEVVSMARPTMSYGLYAQQFGRMLRTAPGKEFGILIDHVGNVVKHGLPDRDRAWTLDGGRMRESGEDDSIPLTVCANCMQPRKRIYKVCPYCGHVNEPATRGTPEEVDGDLLELDPEVLEAMRGQIINIESGQPKIPYGADNAIVGRKVRDWGELCMSQHHLRNIIAQWAGVYHQNGETDDIIHRRFYLKFGTDVVSAMALRRADADKLTDKIREATL